MKVTLNWLKEYVAFDGSPEQLADRLTMLGLEVEGARKLGGEFDGIVVAQVLTCDPHPNADKLSLCRVNDGRGERQIVCGAKNFKVGDKVPLILPGATLPAKPGEAPLTIKVGRIRGVESHGMLCSPRELGLAAEGDGLLILPADAQVGQPFAEHLGRAGSDTVYDLEITPNRPDLNSVIGIAREIAAVTGEALRVPEASLPPSAFRVDDLVAVRLEDPERCPRYTARVVRGVKVGPSPDWLRVALEKVGLRSINNVVDVTNYVMLETGQPLHAFDYHRVAKGTGGKPTLVVRRARAGEKFVTLDGLERGLAEEMLLIADEQKGIALAGVMGGQNTEINERTTDVLLESAYFQPTNIRRTAKTLGLRTDASYRFERGADVGICDWASRRCVELILQVAGGQAADGIVDTYPRPVEPREITLRHAKVNQMLGLALRPEEIEYHLGQLGLKVSGRVARPVEAAPEAPPSVTVRVPSFRVDLKREIDLIEEVARLHGVERIPATPPRGAVGANAYDAVHDQLTEARRLLAGLGLGEAQGQTLVSKADCKAAGAGLVALANPLSADMDVLRPSLLPGLLAALRHNARHQITEVALFEIGRVFSQAPEAGPARRADKAGGPPREARRLAIALTGRRQPLFWNGTEREAKFDWYDLRGLLEEFLDQFGLRGVTFVRAAEASAIYAESAAVQLGGKLWLGELGQLSPLVARDYDLRQPVMLAELDFDQLLARRNPAKAFKPLPVFPGVRRDLAMMVPEATTHEAVLQAVRQAKAPHLEAVELFDVFRGQNLPAGRKSVAYAFTYRHGERTLTDAEVNAAHEKIVAELKQRLQAVVRE
ncbi:MAG: phenylalanine--tRNA ligase subunit beta [Verrucomicrobia bacterium]|nr:phenylalanine--tRNA ligase subunit beta [Verrucomicrobiota bacterium]